MNKKISKKLLKKILPEVLPPLLFPAKTKALEAWMAKLNKIGKIRKIGPRLYTSLPRSQEKSAVRGGWKSIITELYPNALLSYRSALEFKPSPQDLLILTSTTNKIIHLPGLTLQFVRGPAALDDDLIVAGFKASSTARALLENFSTTKNTILRSLSQSEIELRLEQILQVKGETSLNTIRDQAREIATKLKWQREFAKLDKLIGAILGTRSADNVVSSEALARAVGRPYDSARMELFDNLYAELRSIPLLEKKDVYKAKDHFRNKAFFESYFSNYIEGTMFEIEEAEEIVFEKKIPRERSKDGHDILGTFNIVSDPNEMNKTPYNEVEFIDLLKTRHKILMAARPEVMPGVFKKKSNRAGDTHFVQPDLAEGTLAKGFERYQELPAGLNRAIFMMFLVAEVHPFKDGNGRVARIMMNAELFSEGLSTIIIPTVYREDYLGALRALSRRSRIEVLVKMLVRAQQFSNLEFSPYPKILHYLKEHNWLREPNEATIILK